MYFRPEGKAVAADVIPYYKDGVFYLYYLHDYRDAERCGEGVPWYLVKTKDFVTYSRPVEILPRGGKEDEDLYVFTGSVIEYDDTFYLFYTGHNPHLREKGRPEQCVMLAVGSDPEHFHKTDLRYFAPDTFEPHDWRDPFVYREGDHIAMLLAAREKEGPFLKRGVTVKCSSRDLVRWKTDGIFYAPHNYYAHECPDLFRMGDWWYFVFSEFSDRTSTRYRMARSPEGPWIAPPSDTFDARSFYAAKTVSDGRRRYVIGWDPTREGDEDYKPWQWGGTLVVHELVQNADGTLVVRCPDAIAAQYDRELPVCEVSRFGDVSKEEGAYTLRKGGYARVMFGALPRNCKIECEIRQDECGKDFGLALRMNETYDLGYFVKFDPVYRRMCFDRNFRPGDVPFMIDSERPLGLKEGVWHHLTIIVEGTVAVCYIGGVAMSVRMYDYREGGLGIFANECGASFRNIRIFCKEDDLQA